MAARAHGQRVPEIGRSGKFAQHPVDIPQIAQAAIHLAIGKQMRDRMADHVCGRQDMEPVPAAELGQPYAFLLRIGLQRDGRCEHGGGIRAGPRRAGKDGVMHIDHPVPLTVDQRRQLMHPAAIILIVIGVFLHPFPSGREQRLLHLIQILFGDKDVQITNRAASPGNHVRRNIGRAFQQNRLAMIVFQRAAAAIGFPQRRAPLLFGRAPRVGQHGLHLDGQTAPFQPDGQRTDQPFRAGHRDQCIPLARPEIAGQPRVPQGGGEAANGGHGHCAQSWSISSSPSSPRR